MTLSESSRILFDLFLIVSSSAIKNINLLDVFLPDGLLAEFAYFIFLCENEFRLIDFSTITVGRF
jgi:hypothetical protein